MFISNGERELQKKYGSERRALAFYDNQMLDHLNQQMIDFLASQEIVFISTADSNGNCDATIRTGMPGFVRVIDSHTLIYPEYRGNGVMASLGNISENAHIGMLFVDFFKFCIGLHVNGKATIINNSDIKEKVRFSEEVLQSIEENGDKLAERWVCIEVEEAYIHCSKHIPLLKRMDKTIHWGTDDEKLKGGDFFGVKSEKIALNRLKQPINM
jgi:predicted pyridoxine 5'-phosphate oxidase superfamily flavin-nucleotide-binding protein